VIEDFVHKNFRRDNSQFHSKQKFFQKNFSLSPITQFPTIQHLVDHYKYIQKNEENHKATAYKAFRLFFLNTLAHGRIPIFRVIIYSELRLAINLLINMLKSRTKQLTYILI
jgi:hypothetical protein